MLSSRSRRTTWSCLFGMFSLAFGVASCGESGEAAESVLVSTGTSSTTTSPPPQAASPTPPSTSPAETSVQEIEVHIDDGDVHTESDRVEIASGATVRLVVRSNVNDELHVHGVDQSAPLSAGIPTTMEFVVDEPGIFDVETHQSELLLLQLVVR
jgi:plastocyanin